DVDEGRDEGGVLCRDPEIAGAGEREPRARGRAVDRGDNRLFELPHREHGRVVMGAEAAGDVTRGLLELVQVLPHAEAATGAGEDDGADLRVARILEGADELAVH